MTRFATLMAASMLVPVAAFAAGPEPVAVEPVIVAPVAPPSGDWGGFYAGAQLGYGFGNLDLDPTQIGDVDADGALGGFTAGYNWDLGDWVLGVEAQYDWANLSVSNDTGASGSFDDFFRLKARAGRDLGNTLIYASAGAVYSNFSGATNVLDIDWNDPGYVLGVGVDYKLNETWVLGGEYLYQRFNDFGTDGNDVDVNGVYVRAMYQF